MLDPIEEETSRKEQSMSQGSKKSKAESHKHKHHHDENQDQSKISKEKSEEVKPFSMYDTVANLKNKIMGEEEAEKSQISG